MRPLIIKSIIAATFYVSSTAVQIADPTIRWIPFANAMRLSATIVFLFSSATGSTTKKNVCEQTCAIFFHRTSCDCNILQPVSLVYNCQTRNRNVKSNFHELDRSLNTNKQSFDWEGNGKLNRRRAISSKKEVTIKQQEIMPPSATTRLNVSYVNSLFICLPHSIIRKL